MFTNRKNVYRTIVSLLTAAAAVYTGSVSAAPPTTLMNTTWNLVADQESVTMYITSQGALGTCKLIIGTLGNVDVPIRGFYCPNTGRVHFIHKNLSTLLPMRVFDGIVWDASQDLPYQMSGTYTSDYAPVKPFGYYGFSATTQ